MPKKKTATKKNVFAELNSKPRLTTPNNLRGEAQDLWNEFIKKYITGDFNGISNRELLTWAETHVGLNCSLSCFRDTLSKVRKHS